jgi:hypothetical protein
MMGTKFGITFSHPFQLGAVLALAYKHSSYFLIRAPGDGKNAAVHAAMRLLQSVAIVVDPTLSTGANQAVSATAARLFAVHWDGLSASSQRHLLRNTLQNLPALKERRGTTLVMCVSQRPSIAKNSTAQSLPSLSQKGVMELSLRRGSSRDEAPQNACFEGMSVNTLYAARILSLPPPRCGSAETLPLRGQWVYVAGYSPGILGPSTHSTALCSSLRPDLGLFARGLKSECRSSAYFIRQ